MENCRGRKTENGKDHILNAQFLLGGIRQFKHISYFSISIVKKHFVSKAQDR
jgi:hypothetical protein